MNLQNSKKQIIYPGFVSRIFSTFWDLIIISLLFTMFGSIVSRIIFTYYFSNFINEYKINPLQTDNFYEIIKMPEFTQYYDWEYFSSYFATSFIFNILCMSIYFIGFWKFYGSTPGKLLMRMKIVDINGNPPTIKQCIKRFFAYSLFPIGIWSIITNKYSQSLHDKIAKTFVIKD